MKLFKIAKSLPKVMAILLYLLLFMAVILLMSYVQNLLDADVKINLTEVVTQNKDVITSKISLETNKMNSIAKSIIDQLAGGDITDDERLRTAFLDYAEESEEENLFVTTTDGIATFPDGSTLDVSGRNYFKLARQGRPNISDRIVSRRDGEDVFIISVPLAYKGGVLGTVQRFFSPQQMHDICSVSLFSSEGNMHIINKEGYILISSRHEEYCYETGNYYKILYSEKNKASIAQLQEDVNVDRSGFMETIIDGKKTFSAYTPIDELHEWYLISSVATSAVSPNAEIVINMFYVILIAVALVFGLSFFSFLTYKNKQQAALEHVAFVDSITQGITYNKFVMDMQHVLREHPEKQYHLMKFDIDNFKYINNFYGFDFGNKILAKIYQNASTKLLHGESIARIYSDHFVMLLENSEEDRLNDLMDAMQNAENIAIYFSAGIYTITDHTEDINLIVDKARIAAGACKGLMNIRFEFYSEKFDQLMVRNEQLKRSVEQALADNEIIPFYQPKVNIHTGEMVGAEALARWITKEGKLVSPFEFIPMCEKTGLVTELDMAIFEKVLQFLRRSLDVGNQGTPISVNFSRLHLLNKEFIPQVMEKIKKYNIPTNLIEIELTESAFFENYEVISTFVTSLHENGFLISMDDFGSGYSSLNMLKDIPIDVLKIDKGFLDKTSGGDRQRTIFAAIVQMAQQLNIKVVVEGVEFIENVELMKETGCLIAQGYYFAKPMEEAKFEELYCQNK